MVCYSTSLGYLVCTLHLRYCFSLLDDATNAGVRRGRTVQNIAMIVMMMTTALLYFGLCFFSIDVGGYLRIFVFEIILLDFFSRHYFFVLKNKKVLFRYGNA